MLSSNVYYSPSKEYGSGKVVLTIPNVPTSSNGAVSNSQLEETKEVFISKLQQSEVAKTVQDRVLELVDLNPKERLYDSTTLLEGLSSKSVIERAIAIGEVKSGAPEIIYDKIERQELFELERAKIALRSMEHAQAGRAFNDFRAQLAICTSSLHSIISSPMPPRACALSAVAAIYATVLFDVFHENVEKPYVFLPTKGASEPQSFIEGIERLKELLFYTSLLERSVQALFELTGKEEVLDLSDEVVDEFASEMLKNLKAMKDKFNLSEPSEKFGPETLGFAADSSAFAIQWIQDTAKEIETRDKLFDYIAESSRVYGDILQSREKSIEKIINDPSLQPEYPDELKAMIAKLETEEEVEKLLSDLRSKRVIPDTPEVTLLKTINSRKKFHSIKDQVVKAKKENLSEAPFDCVLEDMEGLRSQIMEAVPKSAMAREIALDRIQFASGEIELDEMNLSQIILSLPVDVKPKPGKETLIVEVPEDEEIFILGNERRIRGAISNIINNAFHYGDTLIITLNFDKERGQAVISLKDNGKGVAAELLEPGALPGRPKIFDLGVTKREIDSADKKKGTGVGTTESYYVFEMHDGSLDLESIRAPHDNHGTTFTARLKARAVSISDTGKSINDFIKSLLNEVDEIGAQIFEEAIRELPDSLHEKLTKDVKFSFREDGDLLNQDFIAFSRKEEKETAILDVAQRIFIPQKLLEITDHSALKIILRDFLLPFKIDALSTHILSEGDPLVRQTALILRAMDRFSSLPEMSQVGLVEALKLADISGLSAKKLAFDLEQSLDEDLRNKTSRALNWAAANQLRPLALRDPISLSRESIILFEKFEPLEIEEGLSIEARASLEEKFIELCRVFEIQESTPVYKLVRGCVLEGKEIPRKPYHRMIYPPDSRSMIIYLAEHGLLTSVLSKSEIPDIERWKRATDEALPLAARVIQVGSDELYEKLLSEAGAEATKLSSTIANLPLLGTRGLARIEKIRDLLKAKNISPITSEEIAEREALAVKDWIELLDKTTQIISECGLPEIIYSLPESEWGTKLGIQLSTVVQFRSIRSTLEAREVFSFVKDILEEVLNDESKLLSKGQKELHTRFLRAKLINKGVNLEEYLESQVSLDHSPVHDVFVQNELDQIIDLVKKIGNKRS